MKIFGIKVKKKGKEYFWDTAVKAINVETTEDMQFVSRDEITEWNEKPGSEDPVTNNTVTFASADVRKNIESGEKLSVLFGKVQKFFTDLKTVAFSGKYNDLIEKPTLGTAAAKGVSNVLNVTVDGYVLDARQGKVINDKFGGMHFYEDSTGKYVVGADLVKKKLDNSFETKKVCICDKMDWYVGDTTGYEVIISPESVSGSGHNYNLGIHEEVYIQIDAVSIAKFGGEGGTGSEPLWRDNMGASYNTAMGSISVNYGSHLYRGGGNCCKMTILYRD